MPLPQRSLRNDDFLQLSPGTHGLYDDSNPSTQIGKVIITGGRETWIFKQGASTEFPDTFYLSGQSQTDKSVQSATVFEYKDKVFRGDSAQRTLNPSGTNLYQISKSSTTVGYLDIGSTKGSTLTWYVASIDLDSGRFLVASGDTLKFAKQTTTVSNYDCYTVSAARLTAL